MSRTVENPEKLRATLRVSLRELADDAHAYLRLLDKLSAAKPDTEDVYRDLELDVDLAVTTLFVHASSTKELFEKLLDSLPEDADSP